MKTPEHWADELQERMCTDSAVDRDDMVKVIREAMREAWCECWDTCHDGCPRSQYDPDLLGWPWEEEREDGED